MAEKSKKRIIIKIKAEEAETRNKTTRKNNILEYNRSDYLTKLLLSLSIVDKNSLSIITDYTDYDFPNSKLENITFSYTIILQIQL